MKQYVTVALVSILAFAPTVVKAESAKEIIEKAEKSVRGDTMTGRYEIIIKTKRWERTLELKSWDQRIGKKSFSEIIAPKKDAGNRFLMIEKNMQHYVPKLQKVIRIAPSMMLQSWMGSDFTNDDIVKESSILDDYHHRLLGKVKVDGFECYSIEMIPKPEAAVVWGKIIYQVRVKDYLPVREEFYNEHNVLKKIMSFSNFRELGGRTIPATYRMQAVSTPDRFTVMHIKEATFGVPIPAKVFSLQNLQRK